MALDIFANDNLRWLQGNGDPNGSVSANTGSLYVDLDTGNHYKNGGGTTWTQESGGGDFNGNTSGTCISDLYLTNLNGCDDITINSSLVSPNNTVSEDNSLVLGTGNTVSGVGNDAAILGDDNNVSANQSMVVGTGNTVNGDYSFVNGKDNVASGNYSFINGFSNTGSTSGFINGNNNDNSADYSFVGGFNNVNSGDVSFIFGASNTNRGQYSAIVGGNSHNIDVTSTNSAIVGGGLNSINGATNTVILGGNSITATKDNWVYVPNINLVEVPAYADDAAAGVGGLAPGDLYQTDGTGAAPLNVAGILMIKQ